MTLKPALRRTIIFLAACLAALGLSFWGSLAGLPPVSGASPAQLPTVAPGAEPIPPPSPVLNALRASNHSERFEHLTVNDGLSQSTIYDILQDGRGFLWFATDEGANRYDGSAFKIFRNDPDLPSSLSDNNVMALAQDPQGGIWMGTLGGGLNRYDSSTGQFTRYRSDPARPDSLASNDILRLAVDRAGRLYAGTPVGLERFDPTTQKFSHFPAQADDPNGLAPGRIRTILEDSQGFIWVGTSSGLERLDPNSGAFTHYRVDPTLATSLSSNSINALALDSTGQLWVATGAGLDRLDSTGAGFIHYKHDPTDPTSLPEGSIISLAYDRAGQIWAGSDSGHLVALDPFSGRLTTFSNSPEDPYSLSPDGPLSLYFDNQGVLWIGTAGFGINKLSPTTDPFVSFRNDTNNPGGLSNNRIFSIFQDNNNHLLVGTIAGLDVLDTASGKFKHFASDPANPTSLSAVFITALEGRPNGQVWVGSPAGVDLFDLQRGAVVQRYASGGEQPNPLSSGVVVTIHEDGRGLVWIGSNGGGFSRLDPITGQITQYHHKAGDPTSLPSERVWWILEDREGGFWLGTGAGLVQFDRQAGTFTLLPSERSDTPEADVFSLYEDRSGDLWLATYGAGLKKLDRKSGSFSSYRLKNGLPSDVVYGVLEDRQGRLWMSTNRGIARLDPASGSFKNFDVIDGLQGNEFNTGAFFESHYGEMFFGGLNGLTAFRPEDIRDNRQVPPVMLTSLTQYGDPLQNGPSAVEAAAQVTLQWPNNTFEFEFAALNYIRPEKNQYAYFLESFDRQWNQLGTRHSGRYTNLPGGEYTLQLRGSNNDGVWNETGAALKIVVVPPFWETVWFRGGLVALLGLAVVTGYRLRLRSIQQRNQELERMVQARTAEIERRSRDMQAVYQADERMRHTLTVEQAMNALLDVAVEMLQAEKCAILAWDDAQENLVPRLGRGFSDGHMAGLAAPRGQGLAGLAAAADQALVVNDTLSDPRLPAGLAEASALQAEGVRSLAVLPIGSGEQVFGVFSVFSSVPGAFNEDTCRLFTALAQRAALTIENARLFEQTREVAVIEERARLARDLHDSAKQKAFAALAQLGAARGKARRDAAASYEHLGEAENLVFEVIQELTFLIQELYPLALKEKGLANALREYIFEWENQADIHAELTIRGEQRASLETEQALYRVVQEALANVARHSKASRVTVNLDYASGRFIEVVISDNGQGFNPDQRPTGMGLGSMRARVEKIHGELHLFTGPGEGTRLVVRVPLKK